MIQSNQKDILFSVVLPVYNSSNFIIDLYSRIEKVMQNLKVNFEVIFVEDCGIDNSWEIITKLAKNNNNVVGIKLSKNFGQHKAITAGLANAKGDYICVMDCDLQDLPEEIPNIFHHLKNENVDIVVGRRQNRQDVFLKKMMSYLFYKLFNFLSGFEFDNKVANFGIYSKRVIDAYLSLETCYRFFPIDIKTLGFKYSSIDIKHGNRASGKSSYNFSRLVSLAINNIIYFSTKPLNIVLGIGAMISFLSFIVGAYFVYQNLINHVGVQGWTSVIVSIYFLSGIMLSCLGVVGLYIQKIFQETQKKSLFIIDDLIEIKFEEFKG